MTWDDGGVFVAEFEYGFEGVGPAEGGGVGGGVEEGVEVVEDEVAGVDDVVVGEMDDEVVVGVAGAEVVHGEGSVSEGEGVLIGDLVLGGDVGLGPVV